MKYTIAKLAKAADISVRTLHYYDEIKLLSPLGVEENGYRFYGESELYRLQQILFYRELEFPLSKIKDILDAPTFSNLSALIDHREVLLAQKSRTSKLIKTLDFTINNIKKGQTMKANDLYGGFTKVQMEKYQKEAEEKWGNTDAYKQSKIRVKAMGKKGLVKIGEESRAIEKELANHLGESVESKAVQALISRHRDQINKFYDVTDEIYKGLADMYVDDPRFKQHYEDIAVGLSTFLHRAIIASLSKTRI